MGCYSWWCLWDRRTLLQGGHMSLGRRIRGLVHLLVLVHLSLVCRVLSWFLHLWQEVNTFVMFLLNQLQIHSASTGRPWIRPEKQWAWSQWLGDPFLRSPHLYLWLPHLSLRSSHLYVWSPHFSLWLLAVKPPSARCTQLSSNTRWPLWVVMK